MLFERRSYTLRPGNAKPFWALQEKWNTPAQIPGLLARNAGYFQTIAGPAEQVVHLYRFDSFDDWKTRLFGIYTADRAEYFTAGRALLAAQENIFLALAPIPEINPIWCESRDWLPGRPFFADVGDTDKLVIVESTLDFVPGGLPIYWAAYQQHVLSAAPFVTSNLIGCFYTLVGLQHRVIHYRWFENHAKAQAHQEEQEESPAWRRFADAYRPYVAHSSVSYLKPSPVAWMHALFTPVGPY